MHDEHTKSLDILGIRPVAASIEKVTEAMVNGARAFLSRVCLPASEEFGLLLKDHVVSWRSANAVRLANNAEMKVRQYRGDVHVTIHPRIAHAVFDQESWSSDETVQNMWAGLLASACEIEGGDDSNIIFTTILSQLTGAQVRILRHVIERAEKYVYESGWPYAEQLELDLPALRELSGTNDEHRIDRELDHLRSLELIGSGSVFGIGGGFSSTSTTEATLAPTPLALHLYARGEGFPGSPTEFFSLSVKQKPNIQENGNTPVEG